MAEPALQQDADTLELLRSSVEDFARNEIAPLALKADADNAFPHALWAKMGELGLLGITVAEEYGGAQMGYLAHVIAMEEISRASPSVGLSYGAHSNLCVNQIARNGSEEQKKAYLPKLVSGEHVGALAMSEPNAGSDVVSMRTAAKREKGCFVLNGTKMWITNGPTADVVVVYAKTDPGKKQHGITAFVVTPDLEGYDRRQKLDKLGMRGSETCELVFTDCRVPEENVLGGVDEGVQVLMSGLDYERLVLAGGPLGIMRASYDLALSYAGEREQFGRPIGEFQLIQAKLADMYANMAASRRLVYGVAGDCDAGRASRVDCAACILFAAEQATAAALDAVQVLGGNGYTNEYPAGMLLRDAKLYEIGAGTSEIRRTLIGRELFKAAHGSH